MDIEIKWSLIILFLFITQLTIITSPSAFEGYSQGYNDYMNFCEYNDSKYDGSKFSIDEFYKISTGVYEISGVYKDGYYIGWKKARNELYQQEQEVEFRSPRGSPNE